MIISNFLRAIFCIIFTFCTVFSSRTLFAISASEHVIVARKFLKETEQLLKSKNNTQREKKQLIIKRYIENIDFNWNAKMALGRLFLQLSPDEQKKYINEYKKFMIYTWLPKLSPDEIDDVNMRILEKSEKIKETEEYVKLVIELKKDKTIYEAVLRTRIKNGKFQILNICVEGIDLAVSYRADFLSYIEQNNNNPKSIIKYLEEQNKKIKKSADFKIDE